MSRYLLPATIKTELDKAQHDAPWGWYVTVAVETSPPAVIWTGRYYFGGRVNAPTAQDLLTQIRTRNA